MAYGTDGGHQRPSRPGALSGGIEGPEPLQGVFLMRCAVSGPDGSAGRAERSLILRNVDIWCDTARYRCASDT